MALKPFRYLRDPVFLISVALFLINKLVLKPHTQNAFVHGYVNDLLCIPVWVPVMVTGMRLVKLRDHDQPPTAGEVIIPLIIWSLLFEVVLPQTKTFGIITTADPLDVLSYVVGAAVAAWWWHRPVGGTTKSACPPIG